VPCLARVHRVEEVLDPQQSWASRDDLDAFARRLVSLLARVGHLACPSSCDSGPLAGSRRACSSSGDSGPLAGSRHARDSRHA
jgi:hypothetical protein